MSGDVCEELQEVRRFIQRGLYCEALAAITAAEKAWDVEVSLWADALLEAEKAVLKPAGNEAAERYRKRW